MTKVYLTLVIPCYNEGPTFAGSIKKIISVLEKTKKSWEIIFVEDKSTDQTKDLVEELLGKIENASAIFHNRNQGRGKSVSDGILKAKGEICGFLDVDLEVSADYIPLFVTEVENGADMAVGKRFYEQTSSSIGRYIASKAYARIVKITLNLPISDTEAGYKFFRRRSILPILAKTKDHGWFWDTEICARAVWAGLKISQVPVLFVKRADKKSTVKVIGDSLDYFVKLIQFRRQNGR